MRVLAAILLVSTYIFAVSNAVLLKASLFSLIVDLLDHNLSNTAVYIDSKEYRDIPKFVKKYRYTDNCLEADILFVDTLKHLPKECIEDHKIFVTKYRDFISNKDKIIGAFFWQKGRPTIIFNKNRLEDFGIELPQKYSKYIE